MNKLIFALMALPAVVVAQNVPKSLNAVTPENIPSSAGAVTNVFVSASNVITVTVPYFADTFIMGGDPMWVCEDTKRCSSSFPTSTVSSTGWIFNPQGRMLKGNLLQSTSIVYVTARPQDMVSGTNLGVFEWYSRKQAQ